MGNSMFNKAKTPLFKNKEILTDKVGKVFKINPDVDFNDQFELSPQLMKKILVQNPPVITLPQQPPVLVTLPPPVQVQPVPPVQVTPPVQAAPPPVQVEPAAPTRVEIDNDLQNLIREIPIANPGSLITDEYHNSLRNAVRGLARRIGLSVNPSAEFRILTFAPNFLPVKPKDPNAPNFNWNVTLDGATLPQITDHNRPVAGGFVVQLPDIGEIDHMIVRGSRAEGASDPKDFTVTLKRKKLEKIDKDEKPQTLITVSLKDVKNEGEFKGQSDVQLSKGDISVLDDDEGATGATVSKRRIINNEKWQYYVSAEFTALDETPGDKYVISSVQIYCIV